MEFGCEAKDHTNTHTGLCLPDSDWQPRNGDLREPIQRSLAAVAVAMESSASPRSPQTLSPRLRGVRHQSRRTNNNSKEGEGNICLNNIIIW